MNVSYTGTQWKAKTGTLITFPRIMKPEEKVAILYAACKIS